MAQGENRTSSFNLTKLRQQLVEYFNDSELRTICFDLQVDYDALGGEGKADKARELVALLNRRERVLELIAVCKREQPNVSWGKINLEGRYYTNNDPNNPVIITRLSENQYRVESPYAWDGVGIFDGRIYFGVFRYKDAIGDFSGVWGTHKGEFQLDESLVVHGTNTLKKSGEFDVVWSKAR